MNEPVAKFPALLTQYADEIARALPRHVNPERMSRIALTAFRRTPKLQQCDPRSVFAAVIQAAQLGLEPDTLGRSYLVPYGGECQFIPGWKGLVDLVNRAGQASVWTGAVFVGDEFEYQLGDSPFARHRPGGEDDPARLTYVYAVGRVRNAEWPVIEVWRNERVIAHRDRYNKVGKKHYSYDNWEMYARKVVLLQVLKYMPVSPELERAMGLSHAADSPSGQRLTVEGAISNTWEPPPAAAEDRPSAPEGPKAKTEPSPAATSAPAPSAAPAGVQPEGATHHHQSQQAPSANGPQHLHSPPPAAAPSATDQSPSPTERPTDTQLNVLRAKFEAAGLSSNDLFKRFSISSIGDVPKAMYEQVKAWIASPAS